MWSGSRSGVAACWCDPPHWKFPGVGSGVDQQTPRSRGGGGVLPWLMPLPLLTPRPQQQQRVLVRWAAVPGGAEETLDDWQQTACCGQQALLEVVREQGGCQMQLAGSQFLGREQAEEQMLLRLVVEAGVARGCQAAV